MYEALTRNVTVFGDRVLKEVIKFKAVIQQDSCLYKRKRYQLYTHTEKRPQENTARR